MILKGSKSVKKFEEALANRNSPKNIKTFERAKEVYDGIKQVGEVKKGMDNDDDRFRELVQKYCPKCHNAERCASFYGPFNGCTALEAMFKELKELKKK